MTSFQVVVTLAVFAGVILLIALDALDMVLTVLLGVTVLILFGVLTEENTLGMVRTAGGPLALLFGGMVVARILAPTGIFDQVGTRFLLLTRGSGKRFLLGLLLLVAPVCALLPNATTVVLLAPIIIRVAGALKVDFVVPMILTALISNAAGLLTLVGDPATFIVGSSIGMTFTQYLRRVSLGGLLALLVIIPLLPLIAREVWTAQRELPADLRPEPIERPGFAMLAVAVLGAMVALFLFGEFMPARIVPPAAAIVAATLGLLVVYSTKVEPVERVMADVDWRTLVFLACLFEMVEAFVKTGVLQGFSQTLYAKFGASMLPLALFMLAAVGLTSSVLANTPVVVAMMVLVKGYMVVAQAVPETALGPTFTAWPQATLPVFVAMMFGATLGGNATLIGSASNVVSAGICAAHGQRITFVRFLRYGVPVTLAQLSVSALYVIGLHFVTKS
jgi:Na+/H+ antiporter NhaD/arsenite permease-like protein